MTEAKGSAGADARSPEEQLAENLLCDLHAKQTDPDWRADPMELAWVASILREHARAAESRGRQALAEEVRTAHAEWGGSVWEPKVLRFRERLSEICALAQQKDQANQGAAAQAERPGGDTRGLLTRAWALLSILVCEHCYPERCSISCRNWSRTELTREIHTHLIWLDSDQPRAAPSDSAPATPGLGQPSAGSVTNITAPMRLCLRCSIAVASSPLCPECKGETLTGMEIRLAIIGAIDGMPRCDGSCGEKTRLSHVHRATAIWRVLQALALPEEGQEYAAWSARFPHLCHRTSGDPRVAPSSPDDLRSPTDLLGCLSAVWVTQPRTVKVALIEQAFRAVRAEAKREAAKIAETIAERFRVAMVRTNMRSLAGSRRSAELANMVGAALEIATAIREGTGLAEPAPSSPESPAVAADAGDRNHE